MSYREATVRYATKCIIMRGGWLDWDGLGERTKFLYVRKMKRDIFSRKWEKTLSWLDNKQALPLSQ